MMDDEIKREIEHIKHNLDFFVLFWDELLAGGYSEERIWKSIDRLLDRLIIELKKQC